MDNKNKFIFTWRRSNRYSLLRDFRRDDTDTWPSSCPFCHTNLYHAEYRDPRPVHPLEMQELLVYKCPLCGWYFESYPAYNAGIAGDGDSEVIAIARKFDINSPKLALNELGSHLKNNYSDVYNLSWRKFEELAANIFKSNGFYVKLTQASKDGGVDFIAIEDIGNGEKAIVECKKWSSNRTIGIDLVRTIVGTAIDWEVKKAFIVTTSKFSIDAINKAQDYRDKGFEINLIDATELLSLMDIYNDKLPPLHILSKIDKDDIISTNLILWSE